MRHVRTLRWLWLGIPASFAVFWILVATASARVTTAQAPVVDVRDRPVGWVRFVETGPTATRVSYSLHGLPEGIHAFHVHSRGVCDPAVDFRTAGGHYDHLGRVRPFDGSMPTLLVNPDGMARGSFVTERFRVRDVIGRAVLVHLAPDNYANVPIGKGATAFRPNSPAAVRKMLRTGDAGTNIACGVIRGGAG